MSPQQTKPKPPTLVAPSRSHRWQWLTAGAIIAGILALCVYVLVHHPSASEQPPAPPSPQRVVIAQVRVAGRWHGIDAEGMTLGRMEKRAELQEITGDVSPPRGRAGEPWGVPAVEAAACLAQFLIDAREPLQLGSIEIVRQGHEHELRVRTAGGTRILWMRIPESLEDTAVTSEEKLARLQAYREKYGSLDQPAGPYVLDVRPAGGMLRKERGAGE